jgi:DNA-binding CsgD family transcriptional regulator
MQIVAGLRDRELIALSAIAAGATYAIALDWRVALVAAVGVMAAKIGAEQLLAGHEPHPIALPGLSPRESHVAHWIWLGYPNPAIARRLGMSLKQVEREQRDITQKWRLDSRAAIAATVGQIRESHPPRTSRREQLHQLRTALLEGLTVLGLGIAFLALPPDVPVIGGDVRGWLGLSFVIAGILISAVAGLNFFADRRE